MSSIRRFSKRVVALLISLVMVLSLLQINMVPAFAADSEYGALSGITGGGELTNANSNDARIAYSNGVTLDWSAKDPSIGRTVDGWWVGVKMTAPEGMATQADFDGVTLKSKGSSKTWSDPISFWDAKDSGDADVVHFVGLWGVVNEERLNDALASGNSIQYQWQFDWDANGEYEQIATLTIDPENIVLKKGGATVYPSTAGLGTVAAYSEGIAVTNASGNYTSAFYSSEATLTWVESDASIGRTEDGWWVGLKVNAPEAMISAGDFAGVTLKAKGTSNVWSDAMSFWDCKDSSDDATSHFVGLWGLLTQTYIDNAKENGRNVVYSWKFDWDKDGVYEQQVSLNIDPDMVTLADAGKPEITNITGNPTEWTNSDVTLIVYATDDRDVTGYRVNEGEWQKSNKFSVTENGTYKFEVRDAIGNISNPSNVDVNNIDTTPAKDLYIEYADNLIDTIASTLTFGFYKPDMKVTITATDEMSGVDCFAVSVKSQGLAEATDVDLPENLVLNANGTLRSGSAGFIDIENVAATENDGKVELSFTVPAQFRGEFIIDSVTDIAGNRFPAEDDTTQTIGYDDNNEIIVDNISPKMTIKFSGSPKIIDVDVDGQKPTRQTKTDADADTRYVYDGDITATITVKEANFYDDMEITVYRDGEVVIDSEVSDWVQTKRTYEFVKTIKLRKDGDYQIKLDYEDKTKNPMDYDASGEYAAKKADKAGTYTSNIHTIDTTAPVYSVTYNNNDVKNIICEREYYDNNRTATITVTDRNFRPNEVKFSVSAKDINNVDVTDYTYSELTSWKDWTQDGITWTATVEFEKDANYTVDFAYTDIAGHEFEQDFHKEFTVDTVAPENLNVEYEYDERTFVEKMIETVTFHFYKAPVTVRITATDVTAGVDCFAVSVKSQGLAEATDVDLPENLVLNANGTLRSGSAGFIDIENVAATENDGKVELSFTVPAQFRGNVEFTAYDRSENNDDTRDEKVVVVDSIEPAIEVTYTPDNVGTRVRYVNGNKSDKYDNVADASDFASATQAYFDGSIKAKIAITEANFFEGKNFTDVNGNTVGVVHEVGILLTKTYNNGDVSKTEYLPFGATQKYTGASTETITWSTETITWSTETITCTDGTKKDLHTFEINYSDDADYVLTVEYSDFSTNDANIKANDVSKTKTVTKKYESKIVTIDKIDPCVSVVYSNDDVKNEIDGRKYFDNDQTVTITITEHNFRSSDVDVDVIAKNAGGDNVNVIEENAGGDDENFDYFDNYFRHPSNWKTVEYPDGNVDHIATITFSVEANYTFDIKFEDLAKRAMSDSDSDYTEDLFTVDKTEPKNLTVSYSTNVFENILESITFGYYNAQMTVTITAEDETSGIYHFVYSYIKSEGVSGVNAELLKEAIENATIDYYDKDGNKLESANVGYRAVAQFNIPKNILVDNNQFNGTVEFTAFDRLEKSTDFADTRRIVVDNIAPTSQITYNDPIQKVGDISYYAGDINATIVITEANFYKEDVNVVVTKDNTAYPVNVVWDDNSVDVHTGRFTLTEDGDYVVNVTYSDRSTNEMTPYVSNQLTIDTKDPVITVDNVKHQSANNEETISITVSVTDTNIALESFKPVLNAVIKKASGENIFTYETVPIDLGSATTTTAQNGDVIYSYTISNLSLDGFYSLTCTAVDYANHSITAIGTGTDDGGTANVETVNFSVNREGSVFWITTEHNDKYSGETFTDKLNGAYVNDKVSITLHEINVDKVDENADKKTVFTLNDGSSTENITLTERVGGTGNYDKNVSVGAGGWYENTYILNNDNFDHDGVYSLNIITYDKADNSNVNTKTEAGTISFTLDRTNPVVSANIQNNQSINDTEFWVEFEITETNLNAETIAVKLTDNNGKTVETNVEDLGNNEYKFLVGSGYNYTVEITAKDLAGNESELYKVEHLTVSTNIFILWYANTPLFWGSIGGVVLLAGAASLLIVLKKKKKRA